MDTGSGTTAATDEETRKVAAALHLNVEETDRPGGSGCGGSDSGVDVTPAVSCDSSLASGCYDPCKSPLGPFSPTMETGGGPSSLPCYPVSMPVYSRPSTPTWRRAVATDRPPKLSGNNYAAMSSSFHFETNCRNSPPRTAEPCKRTDLNTVAKQSKISTVKKLVSTYDTVKPADRFNTLPRRRRKSKENLAVTATTGSPTATASSNNTATMTPPKEPSLNRAASLRRKHIEQGALAHNAATAAAAAAAAAAATNSSSSSSSTSSASSLLSSAKHALPKATRPPMAAVAVKTKIYHEICSQTCLTGEDIAKVLSGNLLPPIEINRVETSDAEIQVCVIVYLIIVVITKQLFSYRFYIIGGFSRETDQRT